MGAVGKFIKLQHLEIDPPITFTNAYSQVLRIDVPIPTGAFDLGVKRLVGIVGQVRLFGNAQTGGAKNLSIFWSKNQAGTDLLFEDLTKPVFTSPFVAGGWVVDFNYDKMMVIKPEEHPEGTISLFGVVSSGTLTCNHLDFYWEDIG
jgi:hypothetical protein